MKRLLFLFTIPILLCACSQDDSQLFSDNEIELNSLKSGIESVSVSENDTIIELTKSDLKKPENRTRSYGYEETGLDGIIDFPINIIAKENVYGNRYMTYKGVNQEIKLETANNNDNQKFFIKRMPLTGLYYFTPYSNTSYLLSAGYWTNNPSKKILYVKNNGNSFGAVWNIYLGRQHDNSFVLENEDLLEQGSGSWWDVYSLALGVSNNELGFSKYLNKGTQEFEIRPCDDFEIVSMQVTQDGTSTITQAPDFVISETYNNNGSSTQNISTKITKKAERTSTFNKKSSVSTNVTVKSKVGFVLSSGEISVSVGASQEWSYGTSEKFSDDREYNFPLVIAPHKRIKVIITVTRYNATINYKATLRGVNTGRLITENGTWTNVDCTDIKIDLQEYDASGQLTATRTLYKVPTTPTGVR